jgi:DNA-3-methyladenine glycosylase
MSGRRAAKLLPVRFFHRPTELVARELLGAVVMSSIGGLVTAGRIVETEAYLGCDDPASHGYRGRRTERNAALFGAPGTWYVYRSYGMHWCANLVCGTEAAGGAVLLRALEPIDGLEAMVGRRGGVSRERLLCSGPGRLCQALGITRALDGRSMAASDVLVLPRWSGRREDIEVTSRIGITKAADWPLRFTTAASPWASRPTISSRR